MTNQNYGTYKYYAYIVDSSGSFARNPEIGYRNVTLLPCSVALGLSNELESGIKWNITDLPAIDIPAIGNNLSGITLYNLTIQSSYCPTELYIKADGNLTSPSHFIDLNNEKVCINETDPELKQSNCYTLTTEYQKIATSYNNNIFLKFFLTVPGATPPGNYKNTIFFKLKAIPP